MALFTKKNHYKKLFFLSFIFLILSFNNSILRSLRDIIILEENEASVIYYSKLLLIHPITFFCSIIYAKISSRISFKKNFCCIMSYFFIIFLIFSLIIFPNINYFKLKKLAFIMINKYPKYSNLWRILEIWPKIFFYIQAEAWGIFALTIGFWTLTNSTITLDQSKKYYSILSISSNLGGLVAGILLSELVRKSYSFCLNTIICLIFLVLITFLYFYDFLIGQVKQKNTKQEFNKSLFQTLREILKSRYIMFIALSILSYGICINLFEAIWKDYLSWYANGNKEILAYFYSKQMIFIGLISISLSIFLFPVILRKGWQFKAYFTPILFLLITLIFFIFCFFQDKVNFINIIFNTEPLNFIVTLGLVNIVFIKASKYSFFDTSKEMAYIPLDKDIQTKSKSTIDSTSSSLGKGLGAFIVAILSLFSPNGILGVKYILGILIFLFLSTWIISINYLYKNLKNKL